MTRKKDDDWKKIKDLVQRSGHKAHGLGHSQGGMEWAILYAEHPYEFEEYVEDVWDIGGPKPKKINALVGIGYLWSQLIYGEKDFRLAKLLSNLEELERYGKVPLHSIYMKSDAIVPDGLPIGQNHEIEGSHIGGALNPRNLELVVSSISHHEGSEGPEEKLLAA